MLASIPMLHSFKNSSPKKESSMPGVMHHTSVSIPEKTRIELVTALNMSLASTADLYNQLKQAHWNVKGPNFISLHKLFDDIASGMLSQSDTIAERVTSLGGSTLATTQMIGENTQLRAYPSDIFSEQAHLEHLIHNIAILGELTRNNIKQATELGDDATADIYIQLARFLDKHLWFLEAHLQK